MPDRNKELEVVEHEFYDTGFCPRADPEQNLPKYFRPEPVRAISDQRLQYHLLLLYILQGCKTIQLTTERVIVIVALL